MNTCLDLNLFNALLLDECLFTICMLTKQHLIHVENHSSLQEVLGISFIFTFVKISSGCSHLPDGIHRTLGLHIKLH